MTPQTQALIQLGREALNQDQHDRAQLIATQAVANALGCADALGLRAAALLEQGRFNEALEATNQANAAGGGDAFTKRVAAIIADLCAAGFLSGCPGCGGSEAGAFAHGSPLLRCSHCGVAHLPQRLTPDGGTRYLRYRYDARDIAAAQVFPTSDTPLSDEIAQLRAYFPECGVGGRVLDVGCSFGQFSYDLTRAGYAALGLDVYEPAVHVARAKGINAAVGGFTSKQAAMLAAGDPWRIFVFRESFYYLHDARDALAAVRSAGAPKCGVYIAAHVLDSHHYLTDRNYLGRFGAAAHSLFTSFALVDMLSRHGFEIIHLYRTGVRLGLPDRVHVFARAKA